MSGKLKFSPPPFADAKFPSMRVLIIFGFAPLWIAIPPPCSEELFRTIEFFNTELPEDPSK